MKWYAKQLKELQTKKAAPEKTSPAPVSKKTLRDSFAAQKTKLTNNPFVSPVAKRNINRPKTDSK